MGIGNIPQTVWRQTIGKHIRRRREEILSPISVEERCSVLSGEKSAALVWTDASLSGNSEKIGEYALLEAVNNLAAKGAEPVGVSVLASQSPSMEKETLVRMIISMEGLCEKVSAQITCVRAEGNPGIDGNMVYVTAAGILREESQPLLSQITPEMEIILCGYAGLEGTLLIESEAKEELKERFIPTFLRRTEELEEQLCMPAVLSGAFRHGAAAMRQIGSGGISVSYTHLDVYKRQLERELTLLGEKYPDSPFDALGKLRELYERGAKKQIGNPESYAVKNWIVRAQGFLISCATYGFTSNYDAIMSGTFRHDLFYGTFGEQLMDLLGDMAFRYVFSTKEIYKMEVSEAVIIDFLMDKLVNAVLYYDTGKKMDSIDSRVISFISDNYKNAYKLQAEGKKPEEKLYLRLLLVTDYVCGMTDSYAKRLYQEMNGII